MKVLFLSQRVPCPPDRGDRITTYHFLRHLLGLGATVRIGCLAEEDRDRDGVATLAALPGVEAVCAPRIHRGWRRITSLRGLLTGTALTRTFFHHQELARTVDRWVREAPPDLVYAYSSSMAPYVMHHERLFRFMQFAELDSDKWRQYAEHSRGPARWIYRREARRLLELEREVARTFDACAVVSPVERELFEERIPGVTPLVLRNGVDVDHFRTAGDARREPHTVIFTGVMNYEPNVLGVLGFVRDCWPGIRAAVPDARFLVVGSHPTDKIRALHGRDGIEVTGRVAEMPPYMDRAAVAVAPLALARGVQNKVLEAMSTALPVVASPQAAQGLGPVADDALVVVAGPAATAAAVLDLLRDPARAREIGANAARFVREHYLWEQQYGPFDELLDRRLGERLRRPVRAPGAPGVPGVPGAPGSAGSAGSQNG